VIRSLQHAGLIVRDLDASRRFYGEALGLQEVPRPSSFKFGGAWFRFGTDEVHLILQADTTQVDAPPEPGAGLARGFATHHSYETDDLDGDIRRMEAHGHLVDAGPLRRGDGVRQVYYRDPDGHIVELFEVTDEDQADEVRLAAHDLR
jgi:glyoxylase I family protein